MLFKNYISCKESLLDNNTRNLSNPFLDFSIDILTAIVCILCLLFLFNLNFYSVCVLFSLFLSFELFLYEINNHTNFKIYLTVSTLFFLFSSLCFVLHKSCVFFLIPLLLFSIILSLLNPIKRGLSNLLFLFLYFVFFFYLFLKSPANYFLYKISIIPYTYSSVIVWTSLLGFFLLFFGKKRYEVLITLALRQLTIFASIYFKSYFNQTLLSYIVVICDLIVISFFCKTVVSFLFNCFVQKHIVAQTFVTCFSIIILFPLVIYYLFFGFEQDMVDTSKKVLSISNEPCLIVTDDQKLTFLLKFKKLFLNSNNANIIYIHDLAKNLTTVGNYDKFFMITAKTVPFKNNYELIFKQGIFNAYLYSPCGLNMDNKIADLAYFFSNNDININKKYQNRSNDVPNILINQNLIYNPTFEYNLNGWQYSGPIGPFMKSHIDIFNSSYYLQWNLNTSAKSWTYLTQYIMVAKGKYEMSFEIKNHICSIDDSIVFHFSLETPYGKTFYLSSETADQNWKLFKKIVNLEHSGSYKITLMFAGLWNSIIDIKNITLKAVDN